jgi:hypothetical protein
MRSSGVTKGKFRKLRLSFADPLTPEEMLRNKKYGVKPVA